MIRQSHHFPIPIHLLYQFLCEEKAHTLITRVATSMETKVGGFFSVWEGKATGSFLELVPDQKVVQEWRYAGWSVENFSTVTFILHQDAAGVVVDLIQENVPNDQEEEINEGWNEFYWDPLKKYIEKNSAG